jgi:NAD(P)-dependent dehydrogenase (short-subunit alcohol dehydrogenase family)
MGQLDGKVAIITGCSSGIGKQAAIRFAEEGARLAICARRAELLEETAELCRKQGADVLAYPLDLNDYDAEEAFVKAVVDKFGTIDVLVNNATVNGQQKSLFDYTDEEFEAYFHLDCLVPLHMMKLCFPYMRGKDSSIVNIGSSSDLGAPGMGGYAAAKGALVSMSMVASCEWGKEGIRVNVLKPTCATEGVYASPPEFRDYMLKVFSDNRLGYPADAHDDIAPAIVFLASESARYITGQVLRVEGGEKLW